MILIHYYVIFCIVPFAVAEALEWRSRKRPSRLLLAGAFGAFLSLVIQFRQILANRREYGTAFWASPTLHTLRNIYEDMFPHLLFTVSLVLICFARRPTDGSSACGLRDPSVFAVVVAAMVCCPLHANRSGEMA